MRPILLSLPLVLLIAACSSGSPTTLPPTPTPPPDVNSAKAYADEVAVLSARHSASASAGEREFTPMAGLMPGNAEANAAPVVGAPDYWVKARAHSLLAQERLRSSERAMQALEPPPKCAAYHGAWQDASTVQIAAERQRQAQADAMIAGDFAAADEALSSWSAQGRQWTDMIPVLNQHWSECMAAAYPRDYTGATPTPEPERHATPTPDIALPEPEGATYPQQATAVFQVAFSTEGISFPLENVDWRTERSRLEQAKKGLNEAGSLLSTLTPPSPCEAFHAIMPEVLDQQEQIIETGIRITDRLAAGDVQGAYDISQTLNLGSGLVLEMSDHWTACYTAVHPELS